MDRPTSEPMGAAADPRDDPKRGPSSGGGQQPPPSEEHDADHRGPREGATTPAERAKENEPEIPLSS